MGERKSASPMITSPLGCSAGGLEDSHMATWQCNNLPWIPSGYD